MYQQQQLLYKVNCSYNASHSTQSEIPLKSVYPTHRYTFPRHIDAYEKEAPTDSIVEPTKHFRTVNNGKHPLKQNKVNTKNTLATFGRAGYTILKCTRPSLHSFSQLTEKKWQINMNKSQYARAWFVWLGA